MDTNGRVRAGTRPEPVQENLCIILLVYQYAEHEVRNNILIGKLLGS
jgi:hypothetical protein